MSEPGATEPFSNRATVAALSGGSLASATCFLVGVLLGLAGREPGTPRLLDPAAIARGAASLEPWAWSTLGVLVLMATPALGLIATAMEYGRRGARTTALAVLVLAILVLSLAIALVR